MNKISKADRSRNLRYKSPALAELSYNTITEMLSVISEECNEIHWAYDDDQTLINAGVNLYLTEEKVIALMHLMRLFLSG